ncbi:MAG TPA: ADOP family duplicated permease [Bryobacteraceae bacterium]|nr:ADOP family duplicated permease [Bryobacteraceae bacterium]
MFGEIRIALRTFRRAPVFALSTILILALGLGANTGAFSALRSLLLTPLPYPEPQRLVALYETTADRKPRGVAEANVLDFRQRSSAFEAIAVYQPRSFGLTLGDQDAVTVIQTGMVMAELFHVLAVPPAMGRTFSEEEEFAEAHLMVLTDRLWRVNFAADPSAIGRKIFLNEEPYTVVGVMPRGFEFPTERALPDAFIPLSHKDYCCGRLGSQAGIARLRSGVSLSHARSELEAVAAQLAAAYPSTNRGRSAGLQMLDEAMTGNRREPLLLLLSATFLLLAIACANVAGLVLARCLARSHQIAIRASLGAGITQIARQFLAEAAVLGIAGAAGGLLAADLVLRVVPAMVPGAGQTEPLRLDVSAFAIALLLAMAVTLLLAAVPTLWVRGKDLAGLIKAGGRQSSRGSRGAVRGVLVVTQIALSVVLLASAGLLLRSFFRLLATSPGFETAHALQFGIGLPGKRYDTTLKEIAFHRELTRRLSAIPGVDSAGGVARLPLRGGAVSGGGSFQLWGANIPLPVRPKAWINTATPGYFRAMSIPLQEGRDFSWQDDQPGFHRVAIVNQAFVRAFLTKRTLGTLLDVHWVSDLNPEGVPWEVVGVVGDTRQADLDREPVPEIFLPIPQVGMDGGGYIIRANHDDPSLAQAVAQTVAGLDPRIQRVRVRPLELVDRVLERRTAALRLIGAFGGLALLLTAVGVYGIVAFRVSERSRELAIRIALGATGQEIQNLVIGHGVRLAAMGTAAGLFLFALATPLWKAQLYQVNASDPVTMGAVAAVVLAVAIGASLGPSRRASRAAPADLLREG